MSTNIDAVSPYRGIETGFLITRFSPRGPSFTSGTRKVIKVLLLKNLALGVVVCCETPAID